MKKDEKEAGILLRELLSDAVKKNNAEALLLSGGLDTSILAALSKDEAKSKKALTVALDGTHAPDLGYAKRVAQKFHYEHHLIRITESEALGEIPMVIRAVRSFDPALPNDLVIYAALKEAKKLGIKSVMTGDGADELFAGYSYMHGLSHEELKTYITALSKTMWFSSNKLGAILGVEIKQPYCGRKIVDFAIEMDSGLKIKEKNGRRYGKWLLRKAFEEELGEVAWREKDPIEFGSGTTKLRDIIRGRILDTEFEEKKREYGMDFMNKEHLFFYELYKNVVGEIPKAKEKENACPLCKTRLPEDRFHCSICGFCYPISRYSK
ncbi:MAG: asparagine synthase C-terminal domain-containing protein [archaeon]|nr:asparagine synthase C-terminal domain-containing protein [archaeon]